MDQAGQIEEVPEPAGDIDTDIGIMKMSALSPNNLPGNPALKAGVPISCFFSTKTRTYKCNNNSPW